MAAPVRLAVVGAGQIGAKHAAAVEASAGAALAAVVDPMEAGAAVAARHGAPLHRTLETMIAAGGVDGVILATPNRAHLEGALACVAAGLPVLVEKPIADTVAAAERMARAAEAAGVPLAIGHHRRHNPLMAKAKALVDEGALGTIVTVHGNTWLTKPDPYFDVEWRRKKGAGPVLVNLIHDVDLLAWLCGPIEEVQAMTSNAVRGNEVEESAVVLLRFASGALGTVTVSDAVAAPWSWEQTARENPAYPATAEDCYRIAGTKGALALPNLALWAHPGERSWMAPISAVRFPYDFADPLVAQVEQFAAVIRDGAAPLVSGRDGLAALRVVEAVARAAETGAPVRIGEAAA